MADHGQEIVSRGLRFIGPRPFDLQSDVGILPLERQQARQGQLPCPALLPDSRILSTAVRRQRRILPGALFAQTPRRLPGDSLIGKLLVLPLSRVAEHGIGHLTRARDARVRILFDGVLMCGELCIGLAALGPKTLVRGVALRRCLLVFVDHPPVRIVSLCSCRIPAVERDRPAHG